MDIGGAAKAAGTGTFARSQIHPDILPGAGVESLSRVTSYNLNSPKSAPLFILGKEPSNLSVTSRPLLRTHLMAYSAS